MSSDYKETPPAVFAKEPEGVLVEAKAVPRMSLQGRDRYREPVVFVDHT